MRAVLAIGTAIGVVLGASTTFALTRYLPALAAAIEEKAGRFKALDLPG
jgi:hypothetical protein